MGSGKSTVGPLLAAELGIEFIDLDSVLEAASGRSIPSWFETKGEPAFRSAERAELARALDRLEAGGARAVIALGGGAFAEPETRALLADRACTIWLDVPLAAIRSRIVADGGRPLYRDPANVARLFAARQAAYAAADVRIESDAATAVVVERIVAELAARFGPPGGGA